MLAQSRRSAQAKIAEADVERQIAEKLAAGRRRGWARSAMEMYRLNVLERIGREEGSQIVIYGLNGGSTTFEESLAANAAGSQIQKA